MHNNSAQSIAQIKHYFTFLYIKHVLWFVLTLTNIRSNLGQADE